MSTLRGVGFKKAHAKKMGKIRGNLMVTAAQNKKNIKKNRRTIFEVEGKVTSNKAKAYASRSIIEENRALILKNYTAAFMGNRQLANQNTDDIFRNRQAILSSMETSSDVEENFVASMINEANLDFLEHRASLNAAVLAANEKMIAVNSMLIEINDAIMAANEGIVRFNAKEIAKNTQILNGSLKLKSATPAKNAARVKKNAARGAAISRAATANSKKMDALTSSMQANRKRIEKNGEKIMQRRADIVKNATNIGKNQQRVAKAISS